MTFRRTASTDPERSPGVRMINILPRPFPVNCFVMEPRRNFVAGILAAPSSMFARL
jgi:hypothetical protein